MNGFEIGCILLAWGLALVWMGTPDETEEQKFKRELKRRMP